MPKRSRGGGSGAQNRKKFNKRQKKAEESEQHRSIRIESNRVSQQTHRERQSQSDTQNRLQKDAESHRRSREIQSFDARQNELQNNDGHRYPPEYLNQITSSSMPPHMLILKPGAPIMLLRNLDPANGHVNGARYFIKSMTNKVIQAELATGANKGEELLIPRILFHPKDKNIPLEMERKQFPIKPCFSITSNKSQGQTLSKVGIYLKKEFFSHGQLYVALSRASSPKAVSIFQPDKTSSTLGYMKNVVFKEILTS